jgi:leucyl aminopeptidase (aminopeptidase T)
LNPRTIDVTRSADLIIQRLLAVKPDEQVALVCDPHSEMAMVYALAGAVESVGGEYTILLMPTRTTARKNDLTPVIEKGLEAADCLIGLTGSCGAPTYSAAVKKLYDRKQLRTISMVMRSIDNFTEGGARADYDALYEEGQKLAALWREAEQIHLTTPAGTDLRAPIRGEEVIIECGFATEPGLEAAFSDGEVSQMPRQGGANGVIVVDGPIAHIGAPDSPIRLQVSAGRVTAVEGASRQADELRHIIESVKDADNVAEIGIGLNPLSRRNGDFEEEKKGRGNVHIAIGDNIFYGGSVQCAVHMDLVMYRSTVQLDDRVVVDHGIVEI